MSSRYDPYNAEAYRGSSQGGRSRTHQGGGYRPQTPRYTPTVNRMGGGTDVYVGSQYGTMGGASAQDVGAVGSSVGREGALNTGLIDQYDPERVRAESQEATFENNVDLSWEATQREMFGAAPLAEDFTAEEYGMGASSAYRAAVDEYAPIEDYIQGGKILNLGADYFGTTPEDILPRVLSSTYDPDTLNDIDTYITKQRTDTFNNQLLNAGYTQEEVDSFNLVADLDVNQFVNEEGNVDTQAYGAAQRNAFNDAAVQFIDLYDTKQTEKFSNEIDTLSTLKETDPQAFLTEYYNSDSGTRNRFLYDSYSKGELSKDKFKQGVVESLANDGKQIIKFEGEYYYYEAPEGSNLTSYSPDGTEQFFKVNFTPEQFEANPPRMSMGRGMFKDTGGSTIYTGTDALGQLQGIGGYTNFTLDDEASARHGDVSYLDVGIGSQGEAYNPRPSKAEAIAKTAVRIGASILTGGASEAAIVAAQAATGETLHGEDYATLATFGLGQAGIISAPTGSNPEGVGLGSLNYNQTTGLIDAIANESVGSLFTAGVPDSNLTGVLQDLGIPPSLASNDDFLGAVRKFNTKLLDGEDFEDAGKSAFANYVTDGGSFGDGIDIGGTMFDWGVLADLAKPVLDVLKNGVTAVTSALEPLVDTADDVIDWVGDKIDPALQTVGDWVEDNIVDPADDVLDSIGDVTDPITGAIGDAGSALEDAVRPIGSAIEDAVRPVGSAIDDYVLQPVKDALLTGGGALVAQPSGTRTTDGLFSSELFKFSPVEFTDVGRTQPRQAPQELVEDIDSNPFASDFDNRNLFG